LSQQHDHPGHPDVMHKTPYSLSPANIRLVIVDLGCLAAAATELSPTSNLGVGAVSSSLFQGGMSALGMSGLQLVDGAGNGIGNNGGVPDRSSE
ncbi:hypothetical protein Tco_0933071, partial [Tanacetum coccineum]